MSKLLYAKLKYCVLALATKIHKLFKPYSSKRQFNLEFGRFWTKKKDLQNSTAGWYIFTNWSS